MRRRRGTGTGEVGIADGDGDGRVNVLALALGHGELRSTTRGSSSLLCTERAGERNAQRRAGEGRGLARGEGGRGEGVQGGRPTREEETRGGAEEEEEDSRWKANGQTGHRKGGNEMRRVCSPVPRRAFALARSLARVRAGYTARCSSSRAIRVLARRSARLLFSSPPAPRLSHFPRLSVLTPSFSLSPCTIFLVRAGAGGA